MDGDTETNVQGQGQMAFVRVRVRGADTGRRRKHATCTKAGWSSFTRVLGVM